MHPVMLSLPFGSGFEIHFYGILGALGFLAALGFINRESPRYGLDPEAMTSLAVGAVLAGLAGSRVLFVALNFDLYGGDVLQMINVRDGGLVFLGGLIGALFFSVLYVRVKGMNVWTVGDIVLPGMAVAHAFGRVGCLSAGCCYGQATGSEWGLVFDAAGVGPMTPGIHYHPSQVYESVAYILLFMGLVYLLRRRSFEGQVFLVYFIAYSVLRFNLEFIRGDAARGFVMEGFFGEGVLSTSQAICLVQFFPAFLLYQYRKRTAPPVPSELGEEDKPAVAPCVEV